MKISVIIPVHNRQDMIARAVDSVLSQTVKAHEIIVIDDGSTDNTGSILDDYGTEIRIIRQEQKGVSASRNAGIKETTGDWLAFLDSDDEWLPGKLEQAENFHQQFPAFRIFQSDEIWIRNGRQVNAKKKHRKMGGWIFRQCLPLCIISPSAVLIERALLDEVGLFDESFPVCEDYDLWLRIARSYPVGFDPVTGIKKYGGHPDQLSRKYWGMDYYRVRAMEKQLAGPELPAEWEIWLLEELLLKINILIQGAEKRNRPEPQLQQKINNYHQRLRVLKDSLSSKT